MIEQQNMPVVGMFDGWRYALAVNDEGFPVVARWCDKNIDSGRRGSFELIDKAVLNLQKIKQEQQR